MKRILLAGLFLGCGRVWAQDQQKATKPLIAPVETTVVVLGDVAPVSVGESARTVVVMNAQAHPLASQDVEDYLRTDASVDVQERSGAGVLNDISIRGASFEQTLVLLNGLRIDDAETSHFNLDLPVPLATVGDIDVLHGAGSTLYGSDAIGGVVDFLTVTPVATSLLVRAGVGSFGENQQGFLGSLVEKRGSEVLAGGRDFSTGFLADRNYRTEDASSETRLTSVLGSTDILLAGNDSAFGASQFFGPYDSTERTKSWFAAWTQQIEEHTQVAVAYRRHSDIFVLLAENPSYYKNQHVDDGFQGSIRETRTILKNTMLQAGLEETTEQIVSTNLGQHGRNRGAGYADVEWRVPGRGSLSGGLREEVFSGGQTATSPTIAGTLWAWHEVKLRASVGYGFRLPTFLDLYYSDPTTVGNASLKPESAWSYEGGADWYATAKVSASVTVFTSRQHDTIDYTRASPAQKWMATNLGALSFSGVEGSVDWRPSKTQQVKTSWTLLQGTQSALGGLESEYVFDYPVNNARVEWTWSGRRGLLVQSRLGVVERSGQAPYAVWGESVARDRGWWRPYVQMTNLANTGYSEIQNVRMPGRAFVGGVEFVVARR